MRLCGEQISFTTLDALGTRAASTLMAGDDDADGRAIYSDGGAAYAMGVRLVVEMT